MVAVAVATAATFVLMKGEPYMVDRILIWPKGDWIPCLVLVIRTSLVQQEVSVVEPLVVQELPEKGDGLLISVLPLNANVI